jgi:ribosomal subunit interface protein
MRNGHTRFPINVHSGWVDYSPALRSYAAQRIKSRLTEFAPQIRSVTVRISSDEPQTVSRRRCDIEVVTTGAEPITASAAGVPMFTVIDRALDAVVRKLRVQASAEPQDDRRQRIA